MPARAPAEERARPARIRNGGQQLPAPIEQGVQTQPSQTSSFTGAQAGGFGGGNAGGGAFADPICLNFTGGLSNGCTAPPFNHSLSKTGGIGGGVLQWTTAVTPWIVVGIMGDFAGGKTTASSSQSFFYPSDPSIPGQVTTETYTSSVSQSTSGSIRFKAGIVTSLPGWYGSIMPYATIGWIRSKFEGTFSYNASNYSSFAPPCAFDPSCSSIAASAVNWSHQANGVIFGFGFDIPIPAVGPGVVLVIDYSRANFQSFDVNAPVAIGVKNGFACIQGQTQVCATNDTLHVSSPSSNRVTVGLRVKFL
jgi:hypothetical protein